VRNAAGDGPERITVHMRRHLEGLVRNMAR